MLAIRMQRTGRSGHTMFRLVVQDSRRSPSRGKIVTQLGHYDPHQKTLVVEKDKAAFFLEHGAHPSDRVARLFKTEGIALPKWVHLEKNNARPVKNVAKLRRNRPVEDTAEKIVSKPKTPTTIESEAVIEENPTVSDMSTEETTEPIVENSDNPVVNSDSETAKKE
ncbi:MAG: 30S ribosomal protein S16 [Candidatus Saccharimonadales bacterium]